MAKEPLKPKDKVVVRMTRDGAVRENLTEGTSEKITKRPEDAQLVQPHEAEAPASPEKPKKRPQARPEDFQPKQEAQMSPATAERLKRGMKGGNKYGKPVPGQPQTQTINRPRAHGEITDSMINPMRNKRDVWVVNTVPFKGGHYAAYPPKLVEPCLLAGCPEGGIVLDPFFGSGTTGMVAKQLNRHYIGIELNPEYAKLAEARIGGEI